MDGIYSQQFDCGVSIGIRIPLCSQFIKLRIAQNFRYFNGGNFRHLRNSVLFHWSIVSFSYSLFKERQFLTRNGMQEREIEKYFKIIDFQWNLFLFLFFFFPSSDAPSKMYSQLIYLACNCIQLLMVRNCNEGDEEKNETVFHWNQTFHWLSIWIITISVSVLIYIIFYNIANFLFIYRYHRLNSTHAVHVDVVAQWAMSFINTWLAVDNNKLIGNKIFSFCSRQKPLKRFAFYINLVVDHSIWKNWINRINDHMDYIFFSLLLLSLSLRWCECNFSIPNCKLKEWKEEKKLRKISVHWWNLN